MEIKEISDLLVAPKSGLETGFHLNRKKEILDKNGKSTGCIIDNSKYLCNSEGERIGVLSGHNKIEIFDLRCSRTGFYLEKDQIKYDIRLDERF